MGRDCDFPSPFAVNGWMLPLPKSHSHSHYIAFVVLSHETRGVHNRDIDTESIESESCCPFLPFALSWSHVGDGLRSAI